MSREGQIALGAIVGLALAVAFVPPRPPKPKTPAPLPPQKPSQVELGLIEYLVS